MPAFIRLLVLFVVALAATVILADPVGGAEVPHPSEQWFPPATGVGANATRTTARPVAHPVPSAQFHERPPAAAPFDPYGAYEPHGVRHAIGHECRPDPSHRYRWEVLPDGLVYKTYLAAPKEPRLSTAWLHESDRGLVWDSALGARVGIFRYGTPGTYRPQGWQIDIGGAAFVRLDPEENLDVQATDYRFDLPITWSEGPWQARFGYYHLSSHAGDEFLLKNPGFERVNYLRDSLLLGLAYYLSPDVRIYGETAYAFHLDGGARPWEILFGIEYSPVIANGLHGAPFIAANGHLREELDFGGDFNLQAGWQWRGRKSNRAYRAGLQYYNGKSPQYSFFNEHEELLGFGMWFDF